MPKKPPSSLGRSTRPKPPVTSTAPRKPAPSNLGSSTKSYSRPTTPRRTSASTNGGSLKAALNGGGSTERARSHETANRRPRYPPTSSPRNSYYDRPSPRRRDSGFRSVSPRARPPPPKPVERALRRRMTRDSDWMSEDESRPSSRRRSTTPERHRQRSDRDRLHGQETPPRTPTNARPPTRSYPSNSSRPDPRRYPSYEPPRSPRRPPAAGQRSPPPGYRPAPHLAADILRGRPRSRGETPLRTQENAHSSDRERKPTHGGAAKAQPPPKKQPAKAPDQQETKPAEKTAQEQPPKRSRDFWKTLPQAFGTYAGVQALSEHADTAKEWADWFLDLRKTPDEIHELSAKATTAKDTITQIQNTLAARPDIIEGDDARPMRKQIEEAIKNATGSLDKMTKLLQEISSDGLEGTKFGGLEEFYNSYKYKDEWEEKIKLADADLEKQLASLSKLMVNIYSRALMKPAPPGLNNPVPPPAPGKSSDSADARRSRSQQHRSKSRGGSIDLDPPPVGRYRKSLDADADESVHPESSEAKSESAKAPTADEKPTEAETKSEDKKPDVEANANEPFTEGPTTVKFKVDDDATHAPKVSVQHGPEQPTTKDTSKEEEPTGIKPAQPTPTEAKTPKEEEPAGIKPAQPTPAEAKASKHPPPADSPEDILLDAAWNGDIQACTEALRHASPSARDQQGLTPLHLAAERDHLAIAMLLLDQGANCNARANGGRTPLHLAARYGSAAIVEFLVDDGRADPNARTTDGRTPLHFVASVAEDGNDEKREVVRVLRDWHADPTIEDNKGRTPRDIAQKRDYWDVSSTLRRAEKKWEEDHHLNWLQRHGLKHGVDLR